MAKLRVFTVRDSKLEIFMTPFFFSHLGEATRAWEELCNDPKSTICRHPSDFAMYEIGEFSTDTAQFVSHNEPRKIQSALEVMKTPQEALPFRNAQ